MVDRNQIINNFIDIGKTPFEENEVEKLLIEGKEYQSLGKELIFRIIELARTKGIARNCLKGIENNETSYTKYINHGSKYITSQMLGTGFIHNELGLNVRVDKGKNYAYSVIEDETLVDGINKHGYNLAKEIIRMEDATFASMLRTYCNDYITYDANIFDNFQAFLEWRRLKETIASMEIPEKTYIRLLFNSNDLAENAEEIYKCKNIEKYTDTEMQLTNVFCKIGSYVIMGSPYIRSDSMFIINACSAVGIMVTDRNVKLFGGSAFESIRMEDNFGILIYNKAATKFVWR